MVRIPGETSISIKMNGEFIARLDRMAGLVKISRHRLLRNLLELGVEQIEDLRDIGIFQAAIFIRDLQESRSGPKEFPDLVGGEIPIPIKIEEELLNRVDKLAEKARRSRHHFMKNILLACVEQVEELEKVRIISMTVIIRDLPKSFGKFFDLGEKVLKAGGIS